MILWLTRRRTRLQGYPTGQWHLAGGLRTVLYEPIKVPKVILKVIESKEKLKVKKNLSKLPASAGREGYS